MTAETDRRSGTDRRQGPRRSEDTEGRFGLIPAFWALVGALVVVYFFFVALGGIEPDDAPVATAIALGLAVLWLAHSWRRLFLGSRSPSADRERRGF